MGVRNALRHPGEAGVQETADNLDRAFAAMTASEGIERFIVWMYRISRLIHKLKNALLALKIGQVS